MIRCLRRAFPLAQIDMVVRADFLDLIRDNPHLDAKIALARGDGAAGLWRLRKRLAREGYDVVYDAHRSLRSTILMPWLPSDDKRYYQKHYLKRSVALTFKLPLLTNAPRMLNRYVEPLESLGVTWDGFGPEMFVSESAAESGTAKIRLMPGNRVGIIPSAQWPGKRWPPDRFRKTIEILLGRTEMTFLVFGGRSDDFCREICDGLPADRVQNTQGELSIAEAAAVLRTCRFAIANDTGLMHVADAVGVPVVLFLGPTSKEMGCLPFHPESLVLEHDLWCRPCSKNGQAPCIRGKRHCLLLTTPEMAAEAALTLWSRSA